MNVDAATELAGRSVLVTGGAGFVGSHLAGELAPVCDVTVLDDLTAGDPAAVPDGVDLIRGDVRDPIDVADAVGGTDVVFHQAGLTDVGQSVRAPVESHRRNASGTVKVLDAARRADARVVVASSAAVYGRPERLPIAETDPKTPRSPYGVDKLAADQYARTYAELYDLPTVALRYFNVYGPSRGERSSRGVVSEFVRRARCGAALPVHGDGSQTRDFVHVRDVVSATLLAATTDRVGRAYNVGTGESVAVRDVAERITSLVNSDSEVTRTAPREGDVEHSRADVDRAREHLGFDPTTAFGDGLETLVDRSGIPN